MSSFAAQNLVTLSSYQDGFISDLEERVQAKQQWPLTNPVSTRITRELRRLAEGIISGQYPALKNVVEAEPTEYTDDYTEEEAY